MADLTPIETPKWFITDLQLRAWLNDDDFDRVERAVDERDKAWQERINRVEAQNERLRTVAHFARRISRIAGQPTAFTQMPHFQAHDFNALWLAVAALEPDDLADDD